MNRPDPEKNNSEHIKYLLAAVKELRRDCDRLQRDRDDDRRELVAGKREIKRLSEFVERSDSE